MALFETEKKTFWRRIEAWARKRFGRKLVSAAVAGVWVGSAIVPFLVTMAGYLSGVIQRDRFLVSLEAQPLMQIGETAFMSASSEMRLTLTNVGTRFVTVKQIDVWFSQPIQPGVDAACDKKGLDQDIRYRESPPLPIGVEFGKQAVTVIEPRHEDADKVLDLDSPLYLSDHPLSKENAQREIHSFAFCLEFRVEAAGGVPRFSSIMYRTFKVPRGQEGFIAPDPADRNKVYDLLNGWDALGVYWDLRS